MRAGLNTIQQTLTPEAASVLTHSIAEAARRNHGQTTPLHVAATLLAAPNGLLRQACVRSHPQSSHPLQCRALELCFSVALDRLPSTNPTPGSSPAVAEPPISNALMAALKRAQAHQRRGCPEQQQQPLLAVKVELEQLMISILDDPSVSRVMREASFSSTAVKAAVEQSISSPTNSSSSAAAAVSSASPSPVSTSPASPSPAGTLGLNLGLRGAPLASRNIYMYPRLHQPQLNGSNSPAAAVGVGVEQPRTDDVKRVLDILLRSKKRNPVLVGDSDPDAVMREVLQMIESGSAPPPLRNAKVISCDKDLSTAAAGERSQIPTKIRELNSVIESNMGTDRGVILFLGDLKWLVESPGGPSLGTGPTQLKQQQQQQPMFSEAGRSAVAEMAKLVKTFEDRGKLWLVCTASCATYLRCQVYHQTMENDWDIQAVPIAPRSPLPHALPRVAAGNGILSSSVGTLAPMKGYQTLGTTALPQAPRPENADPARKTNLCPVCMENYEQELAKLVAKEFEKSSSKPESNKSLPQWLQLAKSDVKSSDQLKSKEQELMWKKSTEELLKRWNETCTRLHPNFHPMVLGAEKQLVPTLSKPSSASNPRLALEPKLTLSQSYSSLQTKCNQEAIMPKMSSEQRASPPASPVRTDLVLGNSKISDSSPEKVHSDRVKDLTGCVQDEFSGMQKAKIAGILDIDSFKRIFKGLTEKVGWQQEAASTIATTVLKRKSVNVKRHNGVTKSDTWFLFVGPDIVGKRKMANALSELVAGSGPTNISFGDMQRAGDNAGVSIRNFRGKTAMDQVVETIRRNPLSVILLENIDQADGLVQGSIKRAMEKGRLPDSYGREVSLGSVTFIVTANWLPEELKSSLDTFVQCEEKILQSANCEWQLELSSGDQLGKRRFGWLHNVNQPNKLRKESSGNQGLSLDLNLAVGTDDEAGEGSRNSSDVTVDHDHGSLVMRTSTSSFVSELMGSVDCTIMFKPVDFAALKKTILESISMKFTALIGSQKSLRIEEDVLDHIVGGLWISGSQFDQWSETVIVPSLRKLKTNMKADSPGAIRLSVVKGETEHRSSRRNLLPASVSIVVDGL